ncbi:hypothetical protein [Thalassospira xiamenensis]|uniref:Uncharacterized protein n=1 Tax=Thalassospira xiamenensis TaxID=220697 RepID=A0A285RFX8_9PROT|nr:hypothetical protein [Thalassospira xiamenensis]SOB92794.1 hypothetical protein SAMN05428964_101646 [Thalassospira xiamenensis]
MDKVDELKEVVRLEWRPLIDRAVAKYVSDLSESEKAKEQIDHSFMLDLNGRCDSMFKMTIKLNGLVVLFLSLVFFSLKSYDFGFSVVWFSAESVYKNKSIIIMIFSILLVFHSVIHMHYEFLKKIRSKLYVFVYEPEVVPIKKVVFDEFNFDFMGVKYFSGAPNFYYYIVIFLFLFFIFIFAGLYVFATLYMQWSVAVDLYENPLEDKWINALVVCFFYTGVLGQISSLLLTLPIPGKDYSNLTILENLEKEDKYKYRKVLLNIFNHQRKIYRRNCFFYGFVVYVFLFVYLSGNTLDIRLSPVAFILAALSLEIMFRVGQFIRSRTLGLTLSSKPKLVRMVASISHVLVVMVIPWGFGWLLVENLTR